MRRVNAKKHGSLFVFTVIILVICFLLTIGYTAFSDQFTITDAVAHIRANKVVRVNGATTNSGYVTNLDYNSSSILNSVNIPAGGSITYSITATNLGNVPVAVSDVSFSNGNGTINNLSSSISSNNYIKICDNNNECTNGVSKTFDITITNDGSTPINGELDVNLTFSEIYKIYYDGSELGEALSGSTFTYEFTSNSPSKLSKIDGNCDSFNYVSNTLTVINVQSDMNFTEAHTVTYNGAIQGYVNDGATYTYTFDSEWPATVVKNSGTCDSMDYNFKNHLITITNVRSDISLTGTIGNVSITRIDYVSSKNVASHSEPVYSGLDVDFNVTFRKEEGSTVDGFEIVYEVEITNTHYDDYIFRGFDFHPTITASADSDTATLTLTPVGIDNGEVIASGATKTFRVVLTLETNNDTGSYDTSSSSQVDTTPDVEEETGEITASISPSTGNLKSPNTRAEFTVTVTNTFPSDRQFTLLSSNSNLEIVDSSGNTYSNTVHASRTETYTVYVKTVTDATFINNTDSTNIYLSTAGSANISVGTLTLDVDVYNVPDTTKVTVGNVKIAMHRSSENAAPTTGQIDVTWDRIDYGGTAISDYTVLLYNTNNTSTAAATGHTNSGTRTYSFNNVANGTYYVVVYGIDSASPPNSGVDSVSSATTDNGYASSSSESTFNWTFSVDVSQVNSNLTVGYENNDTTPKLEQSFIIYLRGGGSAGNNATYIAPASDSDKLNVYMNNTLLSVGNGDNQYQYTRSTYSGTSNAEGKITINKVTGDIRVEATPDTTGCLIEGTKILMANGSYKNIEDINYDDLVLTYSYETGEFVPEYPIWIENFKTTNTYQETTFSDGTTLKTLGYHGIFDVDLNQFVSVDDHEQFHIGSRVAKRKKDGSGFDTVEVTNIEQKHEKVKYYQIASTRYFNVIANDFLVTDGFLVISNLYGFTEDMTWPKEIREKAMEKVYTYDELADSIPYYIFKGMRAEEGTVLANYGIGIDEYKVFLKMISDQDGMLKQPIKNSDRNILMSTTNLDDLVKNQNNSVMIEQSIEDNDKNLWMVTTSIDNINEFNKYKYLKEEGSSYTLPKINKKNFVGWLNYADNKIYHPGEKITVYYGMHFKDVYK